MAEIGRHFRRYVIEIAAGGDTAKAVTTVLYLLRNQVRYLEQQLAALLPEQATLF